MQPAYSVANYISLYSQGYVSILKTGVMCLQFVVEHSHVSPYLSMVYIEKVPYTEKKRVRMLVKCPNFLQKT